MKKRFIVEAEQKHVYHIEVIAETAEKALERVMDMDNPVELPYPTDVYDFKVNRVALAEELSS